jgi:hypothetical protein
MKFVKLNGYKEDSSYISITIENGENSNSIGDQVWISKDGTELEILDYVESDVLIETMNMFEGNSKRAFKGALLRMGIEF